MVHGNFFLNYEVVLLNRKLMFVSCPTVDVVTNLVIPALNRHECLMHNKIINFCNSLSVSTKKNVNDVNMKIGMHPVPQTIKGTRRVNWIH